MRQLQLRFQNEEGRIVTFTLDSPDEPVDVEEVNNVMEEIIDENAFTSAGGELVDKHSARIVERTIDEIEIL